MRLSRVLGLAVFVAGCALHRSLAGPVTHVSVRLPGSSAPRFLSDEQVASFNHLWSSRTETPMSCGYVEGATVKLSITGPGHSGIWYYNPSGCATLLTMGATPVYKVGDVDAFNKLVGATQ